MKNGTAQMLAEKSGHVKSVIGGLAQGLTGSDKYTTRYHCDIDLFFFHKRNEKFTGRKENDFQSTRKCSLSLILRMHLIYFLPEYIFL